MAPAADELEGPKSDGPDDRRSAETRVGQVVANTYEIVKYLGSGASSHVLVARHVRLGKLFALKLLRPEIAGRKMAQRFRREAKAIAHLNSEHVVSVVDCGELPDTTPYLVMELLEGEDLRSLLEREGPLPVRRAVQIVMEACRGLSVVHAAGLVHRDLKPENLFITRRSGGEDWCKVLDFGVAKMDGSFSTAQGAIVGTVRYMAPEQLENSAEVGPQTDVYALCAILYECLAGRPLHGGRTVQEVMYSVMNREAAPLSDCCPGLPPALLATAAAGIAKQPSARPESTERLRELLASAIAPPEPHDLRTLADDEPLPVRASAVLPRSQPVRFPWGVVAVAAGAALLALLVGSRFITPSSSSAATSANAPPARGPLASSEPSKPLEAVVAQAPAPAMSSPPPASAPRVAPARRGNVASQSPTVAPSAKSGVLGRFDSANPYGE